MNKTRQLRGVGSGIQTSQQQTVAFFSPPHFLVPDTPPPRRFPSQGGNDEVQKDMPSDLVAETHQFHIGLLAVQYQSLHSSDPESVFRFNLRHRPAESIAGHAVFLPYAPPRCIMGNVVISPCIMGTVVVFPFPPFPLRIPPSVSSNSSRPPIHPPSPPQHDIMSPFWARDPWYSGMCSPYGFGAPFPSSLWEGGWARYLPGAVVPWGLRTPGPAPLLKGGRNYNSQSR